MMNEVPSPTRGSSQEQKKTGPEIKLQHTTKGFIQEMSYLHYMAKAQPGGRAKGRRIQNIAQEGTKGPRLSLKEALRGVGGGPR